MTNNNNKLDLKYFPHFIRKNYPTIQLTNEECNAVGMSFNKYLESKDIKNVDMFDISPMVIIENQNKPARINGYHPALILHFDRFVKESVQEINELNVEPYRVSSEKLHKTIKPGKYNGLWTGYFIEIVFGNGNKSKKIKMTDVVKGRNIQCKVEVLTSGRVVVI